MDKDEDVTSLAVGQSNRSRGNHKCLSPDFMTAHEIVFGETLQSEVWAGPRLAFMEPVGVIKTWRKVTFLFIDSAAHPSRPCAGERRILHGFRFLSCIVTNRVFDFWSGVVRGGERIYVQDALLR